MDKNECSKNNRVDELVNVRWDRPGNRHHNVLHGVSRSLVSPHPDGNGRVIVWWPRRGKEPELWEGMLETNRRCRQHSYRGILDIRRVRRHMPRAYVRTRDDERTYHVTHPPPPPSIQRATTNVHTRVTLPPPMERQMGQKSIRRSLLPKQANAKSNRVSQTRVTDDASSDRVPRTREPPYKVRACQHYA